MLRTETIPCSSIWPENFIVKLNAALLEAYEIDRFIPEEPKANQRMDLGELAHHKQETLRLHSIVGKRVALLEFAYTTEQELIRREKENFMVQINSGAVVTYKTITNASTTAGQPTKLTVDGRKSFVGAIIQLKQVNNELPDPERITPALTAYQRALSVCKDNSFMLRDIQEAVTLGIHLANDGKRR